MTPERLMNSFIPPKTFIPPKKQISGYVPVGDANDTYKKGLQN